ncbi:hypothetical protein Pmar_PMAR003030 [Perkinsus marinus ATCC 50983]|uniref:Uncharacterized protein n=1 Tax=Perkinsus marinus (strain ATCC 50983 / TXsc) TaxID=423536 RepID=C5LR74_PERM5|nr:hypothetical protein Pmar_PMAR003030 [Perkinsus marinus ATCC 50983]EER00959.1 hypothetical protein Pmar_PMAR003030 [Perkinsus marinus ATCC 50983]|eukprot:XP_002768241.1 hypothetical protein Pmar_PMAR003030 [Perkinsus marinus ATCC 50983]
MEVEQISITVAALGKLSKFGDWWRPSYTTVSALSAALAEHLPLLQAEMIPSLMLNLGLACDNIPQETRAGIDVLLRRMASASVRGVRNQTASALASTIYAAETLPALHQDMHSLMSLTKIHLERKLTTTPIESLAGILGSVPSRTVRTCIADHLIQRLHNNLCKVDDYVRIAITAGVDGNTEVSDMLITCATSEALDFPPGALIAMRDASGEVLEANSVPDIYLIDAVIGYGRVSPTICSAMQWQVDNFADNTNSAFDASSLTTLPLSYQQAAVYLIHHLHGRCAEADELLRILLRRMTIHTLNTTELSLLARYSPLLTTHPSLVPQIARRCLDIVTEVSVPFPSGHQEGNIHLAKLLCRVLSLLCKMDTGDASMMEIEKLRNLICQAAVRHASYLLPSDFVSLCTLVVQSGYHKISDVRLSLGDILGPSVLVKMKALKSSGAKERLAGLCRTMGFEAVDLSEKFSNNLHEVAASTESESLALVHPSSTASVS